MAEAKDKTAVSESNGKLSVTLVKGLARVKSNHILTVRSLGLSRIGQKVEHPDNSAIRGMVRSVNFLLKVEKA